MTGLVLNFRLPKLWGLEAAIFVLLIFQSARAQYSYTDCVFQSSSGTFTPITGGVSFGDPTSDDQLFVDVTTGRKGLARKKLVVQ